MFSTHIKRTTILCQKTDGEAKPSVAFQLVCKPQQALRSWTPTSSRRILQRHVREYHTCLSNPKSGHTTGKSSRGGAKRGGDAGRDRARPDADGSVRQGHNRPSCPPGHRRQLSRTFFSKARTKEILYKPMEEHNERLTRPGLSLGRRPPFVPGC